MKRIVCLLLISLLVFTGLVGCAAKAPEETGTTEPKAEETKLPESIVIGWSPPDITGVFKTATDFMEMSAEDAKKHGLNIQISTRAAAAHTAIADQVASINNLVQSNVDVLIVSPADVEAVKPALREAIAAGIPVIMVNMLEPLGDVDVSSYIGFDNQQAAKVSAYSLLDALGGPGVLGEGEKVQVAETDYLDLGWWESVYKDAEPNSISGKVAIIEGIAGDFFSNERVKGFKSVIDRFPNVEIVATLPADWNRQKGIAAAENILQGNKELDAIWAASNEMGMGAYIAIQSAQREDEVMVITNDGTPESIDYLREGKIVAETWHGFPEWGWYGTQFAVRLALGLDVPETYDIRPRTAYKVNADQFYPNPQLEPIDWQGIISAAKK